MEKTMNAHADAVVEGYLRRLDAAASTLPPDRRAELVSEIREHLQRGCGTAGPPMRWQCATYWSA
jgi:hypothetical protein